MSYKFKTEEKMVKRYLKGETVKDLKLRLIELKYPPNMLQNTSVTSDFNRDAPFESYVLNKIDDDWLNMLVVEKTFMDHYWESLSETEQEVLTLYYKKDFTWIEVGKGVEYSRTQAIRYRDRALRKLRKRIEKRKEK